MLRVPPSAMSGWSRVRAALFTVAPLGIWFKLNPISDRHWHPSPFVPATRRVGSIAGGVQPAGAFSMVASRLAGPGLSVVTAWPSAGRVTLTSFDLLLLATTA